MLLWAFYILLQLVATVAIVLTGLVLLLVFLILFTNGFTP